MPRTYRDWTDEEYSTFVDEAYRDVYSNLPSVPYLAPGTDEEARDLFAQGWLTFGQYSVEQLEDIRQQFYDLIGIQESQFDWVDYRDLYRETNG